MAAEDENVMSEDTLKKLGICSAYELFFGTDEFEVMSAITEDSGERGEWQEFTEENEAKIKAYREKVLVFLGDM